MRFWFIEYLEAVVQMIYGLRVVFALDGYEPETQLIIVADSGGEVRRQFHLFTSVRLVENGKLQRE